MIRRALGVVCACACLLACASVLGVDKTYEVGAADGGKVDSDGAAPASGGIRCAEGGPTCAPVSQECCFASDNSLSCIRASLGCTNGTDIFCDDPSQCSTGVCCLNVQQPGNETLGTACKSACSSAEIPLCARQGGVCTGGLTCEPLAMAAPFNGGWFHGCQ